MSHIDKVAEAIYNISPAIQPWNGDPFGFHEPPAKHYREKAYRQALAAVAVMHPILETPEDVKQCPRGTVIIDAEDRPLQRAPADDGEDYWTPETVKRPAMVLYRPDWVLQ